MNAMQKKGVSLIAVLLFMLVATIAATATFKWLSSSGFTSGSRMMQREAYQSSVAGLETARSWMTYHANDVGSLIKQYKDNANKPILLNSQLQSLARGGQEFDVWLVGVNSENSSYKLKILSAGKARNGSVHNEVGIFNVDGLYRVKIPQERITSTVDFEYAYFGGSYNGSGKVSMSSVVVNGNWSGNPQDLTKDFIVTGNADLSGNSVNAGQLGCVGGNMKIDNNGLTVRDLFVGGDATNAKITTTGDAYFNGNVSQGSTGALDFGGSVTLNGKMKASLSGSGYKVTIDKDLCVSDTGLVFSKGTNDVFKVKGNVWMPGDLNLFYGETAKVNCVCNIVKCMQPTQWCHNVNHDPWWLCEPGDDIICGKQPPSGYQTTGNKKYTVEGSQPCDQDAPSDRTLEETSCDIALKGSGDNSSNWDKFYLGSTTSSKVYIKSAHPYSDYTSLQTSRTFTEGTSDQPKVCTNQQSHVGDGGCCFNWDHWTNYSYSPYKDVEEKTKMYYMYYVEPGVTDVEFKAYPNNYWYNYCDYNTHTGGYTGDVYAYFVGGELFFDTYSVYNYYNYSSERGNFGSPYCYKNSDNFRPECHVAPWFKSEGEVTNILPSESPFDCAESAKDKCDDIWDEATTEKPGCQGSSYRIKDPLSMAFNKFESYANKTVCANTITTYSSSLTSQLNDCWYKNDSLAKEGKPNDLYNGFLVVDVKGGTSSTNPSNGLKGKFIIIAEDRLYTALPNVADDESFVVLYLKKGANTLADATVKNYFVYTDSSIGSANQVDITGTLFSSVENCEVATVGNLQSSTLTFSQDVITTLTDAGVICGGDQGCGGGSASSSPVGGSSSETTTSTITYGAFDNYYVANAPQLSVTLESQYKADENTPAAADVKSLNPDFVVLPRIIYLTVDPYGTLSDYYNVLPLNGMNFNKDDGRVTCDASSNIKTSGKLYDRDGSGTPTPLSSGAYECSFSYSGKSVPFYVVVSGESGNKPFVNFVTANVEMASTGSSPVAVSVPAHANAIKLVVSKPTAPDGWTVVANPESGVSANCGESSCEFTILADNSSSTKRLFTVTTSGVGNGTVMFQIISGDGCNIGSPSVETLNVSSSVTVNRIEASSAELAAFCEGGNSACPADVSAWPDCPTSDAWVRANGYQCVTTSTNSQWSCGINSSITLGAASSPEGCVVIIPGKSLQNVEVGNEYDLPASIKSRPIKFRFGFKGENLTGQTIRAIVTNSNATGRINKYMDCTLGSTIETTSDRCEMSVFKGEQVEVQFVGDRPTNPHFDYWGCSSTGSDCPVDATSGDKYPSFTISTDGTTVIAHYGETDQHCFFDEFKLSDMACSTTDSEKYCIGPTGTKWRTAESEIDKIDYQYGYVSVKDNRSSNNDVTIMSTAVAGLEGTMKAQLQVPKVARVSSAEVPASVAHSGFILRSTDENGSDYLLLSFFADNNGDLVARLCNKAGSTCANTYPMSGSSKLSLYDKSTIVTLDIEVTDAKINVTAYTGVFGAMTSYTAGFNFSDGFTGYQSVGQYVGFRIANPDFRLFDIGWRSVNYGAECWDTYPTVNCSFRAAYDGGVVPLDSIVKPWVGLSSWFDTKDCESKFFYIGDDACSGNESSYDECSTGSYMFRTKGKHGYTEDGVDKLTAKAGVSGCYYLDNNDRLLAETELGHCGNFWVGELSYCTQNVDFFEDKSATTIYSGNSASFNLPSTSGLANLREATLKVVVDNPNSSKIEIYLVSQRESYSQPFYSKSMETTANGTITINVESLSDADGFDPQSVLGVTIKVLGSSNVTVNNVYTNCPNVVSLDCSKDLAYNETSGKWTFTASVTNFSKVQSFKVTNNFDFEDTYDCQASECSSIQSGKVATYSFSIEDNPYNGHTGQDYTYSVELTSTDGTKTCSTNSVSIASITPTCGSLSTTSVYAGSGSIPQFTYSMANCPSTGCPYQITLGSSGPVIATGNTNISKAKTGSDKANSAESPLTAGQKYRFVLSSTDNENTPFTGCQSAEFEVTEAPSSSSVASSSSANAGIATCYFNDVDKLAGETWFSPGTEHLYLKAKDFTLPSDVSTILSCPTISINKSTTCRSYGQCDQIELKAPSTAGEYECTFDAGSTNLCRFTWHIGTAPSSSSSVASSSSAKSSSSVASSSSTGVTADCQFKKGSSTDIYAGTDGNQGVKMYLSNITGLTSNTSGLKLYFNGSSEPMATIDNCQTSCTSQSISFKDISPDTYNYYVKYNGKQVCFGSVTVKQPSATCVIKSGDSEVESGITGNKYKIDFKDPVGIYNNISAKWYLGSSTKIKDVDCGTGGCWNNEKTLNSPGGTYHLKLGNKDICSIDFTVEAEESSSSSAKSSSSSVDSPCIAFVNGTGGYQSHCYNSGLNNMASGKCYTLNPDRDAGTTNPNLSATDAWWWVETPCDGSGISGGTSSASTTSSSSSVASTCVSKSAPAPYGNTNIKGFSSGKCYDVDTQKACASMQLYASGSGTVVINGQDITCSSYWSGDITARTIMNINIPSSCSVSQIYAYNCD